jgi:tRNA modification GTPase
MIAEALKAQSGAAAAVAVSQRQRALLGRARSSMEQAQKCSETDAPDAALLYPEHVAAHLREALDRLGEVSGAITPDDVLGLVFSNFCIGK